MGESLVVMKINGREYTAKVDNRMLLCDFIRDMAGLTGTHVGCITGNCGACTVLMDGLTVKSCTILAVQANGSEITTVEGLSNGLALNPIQETFHRNYAVQCGFCTPGMLITVHYLLSKKTPMSVDEIREKLSGNLCRCTGYVNIVKSVAELLKREGLLK
jgi:aerobic-type carbon monoxide dehydrogenase small subunit (CoxS/CutS family)